jgi:hypothetical protein
VGSKGQVQSKGSQVEGMSEGSYEWVRVGPVVFKSSIFKSEGIGLMLTGPTMVGLKG